MRPRLTGLPYLADRATHLAGLPHLSRKHDQIKMRDYMERRVTSPPWGPPPPCKQALSHGKIWFPLDQWSARWQLLWSTSQMLAPPNDVRDFQPCKGENFETRVFRAERCDTSGTFFRPEARNLNRHLQTKASRYKENEAKWLNVVYILLQCEKPNRFSS